MAKIAVIGALIVAAGMQVQAQTTVFGLEFGKPLSVAKCGKGALVSNSACFDNPVAHLSNKNAKVYEISFRPGELPSWVSAESDAGVKRMEATTLDGLLVELRVDTKGYAVSENVESDLNKKFGRPDHVEPSEYINAMGARYLAKEALWKNGDITVIHLPVRRSIKSGQVSFQNSAGKKLSDDLLKKLETKSRGKTPL